MRDVLLCFLWNRHSIDLYATCGAGGTLTLSSVLPPTSRNSMRGLGPSPLTVLEHLSDFRHLPRTLLSPRLSPSSH